MSSYFENHYNIFSKCETKSFQKYKESAKQLLHTNCYCIALYTDVHVLSRINMWQREREQYKQ